MGRPQKYLSSFDIKDRISSAIFQEIRKILVVFLPARYISSKEGDHKLKTLPILTAALSLLLFQNTLAQTSVTVEGGATWQSQNDQRVPGTGGDNFSLVDFGRGPFASYRLYLAHKFNERHEVRALYAPFAVRLNSQLKQVTRFQNSTFAANTDTEGYYKFNSYRLTYAYHFDPVNDWKLAAGFTAKVRDAEVRLTQGSLQESKANVGFVPLAHFQASREIFSNWEFRFDLDAMAAPQGRAIDAGLFVEYSPTENGFHYYGGYRTVEGGADNDEVYNFAWIHTAAFGVRLDF